MTPRSLFTIVAKIIGLLFIKDILDTMPQLFLSITEITQYNASGDAVWSMIFTILPILIYLYATHFFIFKTDYLINALKLDKDFMQENFPLNIHRSTVLSIVIIIIGGLLIADNVPPLCRSVYLYYQKRSVGDVFTSSPDFSYIIIYSIKILVGLILTGNSQLFVNYIERKRKAVPITVENNNEAEEQQD